ncbi:GspE/PulE family protein [Megalodesulfovibrio paquesii]
MAKPPLLPPPRPQSEGLSLRLGVQSAPPAQKTPGAPPIRPAQPANPAPLGLQAKRPPRRPERPRRKLGEMLLEAGLIAEPQLEAAILEHKQARPPMRLGMFLVLRGYVDEARLLQLLSEQLQIERYSPADFPLDPALKHAFSEQSARQHECVPLRKRGPVLWLGCLDPSDLSALDNAAETIRQDVEPVLCTRVELNALHKAIYGADREAEPAQPRMEDEIFPDTDPEIAEPAVAELQIADLEVGDLEDADLEDADLEILDVHDLLPPEHIVPLEEVLPPGTEALPPEAEGAPAAPETDDHEFSFSDELPTVEATSSFRQAVSPDTEAPTPETHTPAAPLEMAPEPATPAEPVKSEPVGSLEAASPSVAEPQADPLTRVIDRILAAAQHARASDVHILPEHDRISLRFRVDGVLHEMAAPHRRMHETLVARLKQLAGLDETIASMPQQGRVVLPLKGREVLVQVGCLPTIHGEKVVLHLRDAASAPLGLEDLGLRSAERAKLDRWLEKPGGLFLTSGPAGSGRTALLYALLQQLAGRQRSIVTLEETVEHPLRGVAQIPLHPRTGLTCAAGLQAVLQQDPDVLMVGEIRDKDTASLLLDATLDGHKALGCLLAPDPGGTGGAPGALSRLADMGLEPHRIVATVQLVAAQRLARRVCPDCKDEFTPDEAMLKALGARLAGRESRVFRAKGCTACQGIGYRGYTGLFELLEIDPMVPIVAQLILRGASASDIRQACLEVGALRTLRMDAAVKVLEGLTTFEEFLRVGVS